MTMRYVCSWEQQSTSEKMMVWELAIQRKTNYRSQLFTWAEIEANTLPKSLFLIHIFYVYKLDNSTEVSVYIEDKSFSLSVC